MPRVDPKPDPYAKLPIDLARNPGRGLPKQVVVDNTRPAPRMTARVWNTAAQTLVSGTPLLLLFDSESFDPQGLHSLTSNTSRLTVPNVGKVVGIWYVN